MTNFIYTSLIVHKEKGKKKFAILIDPDKFTNPGIIELAERSNVDYIFVGGSILTNGCFDDCILSIKKQTKIPVVIFPGNNMQINNEADGILLLSLISGRNAELLIGKHVVAAPLLKSSSLEILPTGYILIDGGKPTAVSYISNTIPIPADKDDIAMCTAMAGEMLGLKLMYMDAGSGALNAISGSMIQKVSASVSIPIIVGGGINTVEKAHNACVSGADVVVVGNALEKDSSLIEKISKTIHSF